MPRRLPSPPFTSEKETEKQEPERQIFTTRQAPQVATEAVKNALDGDSALLKFILELLRLHLTKSVRFELARRHLYMMESDQDDLVQDVLIQLWTVDLHRFDGAKASLTTFASGRLRWMLIDRIRKQARERSVSLEKLRDAKVPEPVAPRQDPASILEDAAHEKAICDVVTALLSSSTAHNDDQALHIVKRHHVDNVPLKDIAEEIGRHPANVTRARQRALRYARVTLHQKATFFAA